MKIDFIGLKWDIHSGNNYKSGVYLYTVLEKGKRTILYIGTAVVLSIRIKSHQVINHNNKLLPKGQIPEVLTINRSKNRLILEKRLIKKHNPPLNGVDAKNRTANSTVCQIIKAMDGRKHRWLSMNTKIPESELSLKMKGCMPFSEEEIKKINAALKSNITL